MEDFCTGRYYEVPSTLITEQTVEQVHDFKRRDAKTGHVFEFSAARAAAAAAAAQKK